MICSSLRRRRLLRTLPRLRGTSKGSIRPWCACSRVSRYLRRGFRCGYSHVERERCVPVDSLLQGRFCRRSLFRISCRIRRGLSGQLLAEISQSGGSLGDLLTDQSISIIPNLTTTVTSGILFRNYVSNLAKDNTINSRFPDSRRSRATHTNQFLWLAGFLSRFLEKGWVV